MKISTDLRAGYSALSLIESALSAGPNLTRAGDQSPTLVTRPAFVRTGNCVAAILE